MPAGRPLYPDGPYREHEIENLIYDYSDFNNESELQKHVVLHLSDIITGNINYKETEVNLPPNQTRKRAKFRIDIVVIADSNHYLIECKVLKNNGIVSLVSGIAQLQLYSLVYEKYFGVKPEMVLVTDKINSFIVAYMSKFAKNIKLIIMGKTYHVKVDLNIAENVR